MILLHTTKYGDSSLIIHGFGREEGRISYILKGVGKKKNRAILHPLSILEVEIFQRDSATMAQLRDFYPIYNLSSLRGNIIKNTIALYISELLYRTLEESWREASLYDFLESSIITLNELEVGISNFPLWFTTKYITLLGFLPYNISPEIDAIISYPLEKSLLIPLNREKRGWIIKELVSFLEGHLDKKIEIKSTRVLHEVLS